MEFKTYLKMWKILVFSENIHQDKINTDISIAVMFIDLFNCFIPEVFI